MQKQNIRKIPKKTYFLMILTIIGAIGGFYLVNNGINQKAKRVLDLLGYKEAKNVKAYSKKLVEDTKNKQRGFKFFVEFDYKGKHCRGFIFKSYKNKVKEDLDCK